MSNELGNERRRTPSLIVQSTSGGSFVLHPRRWRDAVLSRWAGPWLDERIARGIAPESGRFLAARAAALVEPRARHDLADAWERVLTRPVAGLDARVPVARANVDAAADEIRDLIYALRACSPVAARDVARARALLTDGTGPVYRDGPGLRPVVAELVADLRGTWPDAS